MCIRDSAHTSLQWWETIKVGTATIVSYFTPGHSPDSISYLIKDDHAKEIAFFTGDWVFIGDVGRADLREKVGNIKAKQAELAGMMYDSTREILPILDKNLMILPAHGAGTSCGKWLSKKNMDSLWNQLKYNPMLQEMSKEEFIEELTSDQPSIPPYFTNSVLLNKHGNSSYQEAKDTIPMIGTLPNEFDGVIIDTRSYDKFVLYPLYKGAINIPYNENFVGVLWSVILPTDKIIVIVEHQKEYEKIVASIMSIGYESLITGLYIHEQKSEKEIKKYTVIDLRSPSTFADNPLFSDAINIPLEELQSQLEKLDKTTTYIPYCWGCLLYTSLDYFEDHKKELSQYDHIIAYCNTGNSSSQFIKKAAKLWYTHITNLAGWLSACKWCPREVEKGPLPLMQQLQINDRSLVLLWI